MSDLPLTPKQEYEKVLYEAATEAVNVIKAVFASDYAGSSSYQTVQIDLALKLLAIVEGVPSLEKLEVKVKLSNQQ